MRLFSSTLLLPARQTLRSLSVPDCCAWCGRAPLMRLPVTDALAQRQASIIGTSSPRRKGSARSPNLVSPPTWTELLQPRGSIPTTHLQHLTAIKSEPAAIIRSRIPPNHAQNFFWTTTTRSTRSVPPAAAAMQISAWRTNPEEMRRFYNLARSPREKRPATMASASSAARKG